MDRKSSSVRKLQQGGAIEALQEFTAAAWTLGWHNANLARIGGGDKLARMGTNKDPIPGPSESGKAKFILRRDKHDAADGVLDSAEEPAQHEEEDSERKRTSEVVDTGGG